MMPRSEHSLRDCRRRTRRGPAGAPRGRGSAGALRGRGAAEAPRGRGPVEALRGRGLAGAPRGRGLAGALAAGLAVACAARDAGANAASRTFFEAGRSNVVLEGRSNPPVRVASVDLALDFRYERRGPSSASYRLENASDVRWEDDVVFVASAEDVAVFVGGRPVPTAPATKALENRVAEVGGESTPPEQRAYVFHLALGPGEGCDVRVTFRPSPGTLSERLDEERQADGLTRIVSRGDRYLPRKVTFSYPLWPAIGFGGGVGTMRAVVRADRGAELAAGHARVERRPRGSDEVEFALEVPPVTERRTLTAERLEVRYALPDPPPLVGASVFLAARALDVDGKGFGANARLAGDLVFFDAFGVSLGAETDFTRTLSGVATLARGSASAYGSAYYGGGVVVAAKPGLAAGLELNAGLRALVVPLDLALQVYPYRDTKAQDVGVVRLLVGVKLGL
ncbi:MAG TPA: hypothetical protein VFS00_01995 [Polyangiaceae bacterium]|nr:hypothetical protein [Polyangiaceae bacterium]